MNVDEWLRASSRCRGEELQLVHRGEWRELHWRRWRAAMETQQWRPSPRRQGGELDQRCRGQDTLENHLNPSSSSTIADSICIIITQEESSLDTQRLRASHVMQQQKTSSKTQQR
ncbi:hypothetical protein Bca52824_011496 [Brassica carinata]|uniref:Uncharacterized protein n=1 Tax=Brassica carinata TaxID=52824 RepID=A0A8X7WI86_BRACI|nr:hypothetical protein Bca52824_011496 [Brassica carinata]